MKNIIIASHRRSGTHLTIDAIRLNFFNKKKEFINLDTYIDYERRTLDIKNLKNCIRSSGNIFKTHLLPDFDLYLDNKKDKELLYQLFKDSNIIYVLRNGKDVMVSLYHYMQSFDPKYRTIEFSSFLKTNNEFENHLNNFSKPKYWSYHVRSWESLNSKEILFIEYEDLINDYKSTIKKLSVFLNQNKFKYVDVRLSTSNKIWNKITRLLIKLKLNKKNTAVGFRKGRTGENINYFKTSDLEYYKNETLK